MAPKEKNEPLRDLSRRERQIMDVVYRLRRATAAEVQESISDAPSYSAVRALLRILEDKGLLKHEQDGTRFVYLPTVAPARARGAALTNLLQTFFDDSPEKAVAALLDLKRDQLGDDELERLQKLIAQARKEGR